MSKQPVIAIFDVGKTNKKLFLFDQNYQIVFERSARFLAVGTEGQTTGIFHLVLKKVLNQPRSDARRTDRYHSSRHRRSDCGFHKDGLTVSV